MDTPMKNTWQGYAVAVLVSLMMGSGGSYLLSSSRIDELEDRLNAEQIEDFEVQLRIIEALTRLEEQVKYIREELDRH